jgi:hypothetical protein
MLDGGSAVLFYKIDIVGVKHILKSSTSKNACISIEGGTYTIYESGLAGLDDFMRVLEVEVP